MKNLLRDHSHEPARASARRFIPAASPDSAGHDRTNPALDPGGRAAAPSRLSLLILLTVMGGQAAAYLSELSGEFRFTGMTGRDDTEIYIALGHSLAHGRGYTRSFDPDHYIAHVHWPPGFPLLVAATFRFTDSLWAAQALVIAFAVLNALLLWAIARRYLGEGLALFAVFMLVCSPVYDQLATHVMADLPTTFFILLALWSLAHWIRGGYRFGRWAVLAAFAIGYGMLVKGLVLPVVAGFGLYALLCPGNEPPGRLGRLRRTCLLLSVALVPWAVWTVRGMIVKAPGYDGLTELQTFLRSGKEAGPILPPSAFAGFSWTNLKWFFADRILDAFAGTGWFLHQYLHYELAIWSRMTVLGLMALSLLVELQSFRRSGFITLSLIMAMLLLVANCSGGSPRYWINLQPLILLVCMGVVRTAWHLVRRRRPGGWEWPPRLAGVTLAVAGLALLATDRLHREPQGNRVWSAYVQMCQSARDLIPPDAVVLSHNATATRWITRRFAIATERDLDPARGEPTGRPVFVIAPLAEAVAEHRRSVPLEPFLGRLEEVTRNPYYVLYRVLPRWRVWPTPAREHFRVLTCRSSSKA